MKIMIHVTKDIIARSRFCTLHNASTNCAISFAIAELFPDARTRYFGVHVLGDYVKLPEKAQKFILDFDKRSPDDRLSMDPIQFEINVPDFIIDEIGIGQVYKILSESKTLTHVNP